MISEGNITLHIPYDEQWRFAFSWCDWNNTNDWVNDFWNFECWYFDNFFTNDIALSSQILPIIVIIAHFYKDLRNGHSLNLKKKCLIFPDFYPTSTGSFIYAFKNYIRVPFFFIYLPSTQWRRWVRPLRGGRGWTHAGWVKYTPPPSWGESMKAVRIIFIFITFSSLLSPPPHLLKFVTIRLGPSAPPCVSTPLLLPLLLKVTLRCTQAHAYDHTVLQCLWQRRPWESKNQVNIWLTLGNLIYPVSFLKARLKENDELC